MKNLSFKVAAFCLLTRIHLNGAVYDASTQAEFDAAIISSQTSSEDNSIYANVSGGVAIDLVSIFSGNSPNTLNVMINGVTSSGSTPFNINAPLTLNTQGSVSLNQVATPVTMNINDTLTQTGGLINVNQGSSVAISGNYEFNGGTLQLGGNQSLSVNSGGTFNIGGAQQTIQVIDSDLILNLPINMPASAQNLVFDTNGFNASLSNTLTTQVNTSGNPVLSKIGLGHLNFSNFTMTGGGECHFIDGTVSVEGICQIPYFDIGTSAGANVTATFSDPSMVLTIETLLGNENSAIQVGDFLGVGALNQTAGTLNLINASLNVSNQGGIGIYNLSGGTINGTSGLYDIGRNTGNNPPTTGVFNLSGTGLFNVKTVSSYLILGSRINANNGYSDGIFNQSGGTLCVSDGATFSLSAFGNGVYNLTGGVLQIGNSSLMTNFAGSGNYQFNFGNGTIQIIESSLLTNANITLLENQDGIIDTNGFNGYFSGVLSGLGSLTKINAGTLVFQNNNTYSGTTSVNGGILQAGMANAFSPFSSVILANDPGVILDLNNSDQTIGSLAGGGSSGGIVQLDSSTLTTGQDNTSTTFSGIITGGGSFIKTGSGTLNLIGPNNYNGGTFVNQGALKGQTTSIQGTITLSHQTQLIFDQTSDGTFNGILNGPLGSTVNKIGPAALQIGTNQSGFSGLTNVTQGNLILNHILGGSAQINQQGTLTGFGQLLGNLNVDQGGIFAPNIGTFTIGGDLTIGAKGCVQVQIDPEEQNSFIYVLGDANLSGNLELVTYASVNKNLTYELIHYNSLSGRFTSVTSNNPILTPFLIYQPQELLLQFGIDLIPIAVTKNQRAVAQQLNSIKNPTPAQELILNEFVILASDQKTLPLALQALNDLEGQQYTNRLLTAEISLLEFNKSLFNMMRLIVTSIPSCPPIDCSNWNLYLEGGGGYARFRGNCEAQGFNLNHYNASLGIQKKMNESLTVGGSGSYQTQSLQFDLTGTSSSQNGLIGLYAIYRPQSYYFLTNIVGGYESQSVTRPMTIGRLNYLAKSNPSVAQGAAYIEGGIDLTYDALLIQPFGGLECEQLFFQPFSESGAEPVNLRVCKKNYTGFFGNLGIHTTFQWDLITASVDLFWQERLTSFKNDISIQFQSFGTNCQILGAPLSRNSFNGAFTLMLNRDLFDFLLQANGQIFSESSLYEVLGGIRFCF